MKYEDIKVGMKVKINLDETDILFDGEYNNREGIVCSVEEESNSYCIGVNVEMLSREIDADVGFKPSELEAV